MKYDFHIVDVFSDRPFGGNQLAVLPRADGLSPDQMQSIAREFNVAETTFVFPADDPASTARLRIFSPGAEMPFAGHPTVGSGAVLARLGMHDLAEENGATRIRFEEQVGPVDVVVTDPRGRVHAELTLDGGLEAVPSAPSTADVAAVLGLPAGAVLATWFASVGLRFCFAHLASEADVDASVLDKAAWTSALSGAWAQHVFLFSRELADEADLYARMFAPQIGVDEDPATGSACAALAGWVAERDGRPYADVTLHIRQGFQMRRPSLITAGALMSGGNLKHVTVGGSVAFVGSGTLDVPD